MFERFSGPARHAVIGAQEQARTLSDRRILPVHLLLGILAGPDCAGTEILAGRGLTHDNVYRNLNAHGGITPEDESALRGIGIDVDAVADAVRERFGADIRQPLHRKFQSGHIPFSPAGKRTLEFGLREAVRRGDKAIYTEHLLLGMLHDDDTQQQVREILVGEDASGQALGIALEGTLDGLAD